MLNGWCARGCVRWTLASLAFGAMATWARPGHALEPSIWYRTGEGCPDGASFLGRLESRGIHGHLAAVGDHVDFVVTLGVNGAQSSGRLERQTDSGTIAIRQVEDARCEAVADALALTLALTLDPAPPPPPASSREPAAPPPSQATAVPSSAPPDSAPTVSVATVVAPAPARTPPAATSEVPLERARLRLGGASGAWDLFEGPWLFSVGAFGELEAPARFALPRATLRLVLQGGLRSDADASAQIWLTAARVEACPWAVGRGAVSLRPCAALDAGAIEAAAAGGDDWAFWSAAAVHARLSFGLGRLILEAQAGGIIPITHYEVTAASSGTTLEKTSDVGFAGGVGVSVELE